LGCFDGGGKIGRSLRAAQSHVDAVGVAAPNDGEFDRVDADDDRHLFDRAQHADLVDDGMVSIGHFGEEGNASVVMLPRPRRGRRCG